MLWLIFAFLTIAVVAALLLPLLNADEDSAAPRVAYDMVVYREQLAEIDEEIASGLLSPAQAEAARAEVHRRMLAAEDAELAKPLQPSAAQGRRAQLVAVAAIAMIVPVSAAALYGVLGSPHLPGKPYAWRVAHEPDFASAATAEALSEQLNANPSVDGYRRLAAMYFSARNFPQAAAADRRAIDLGANDATVWSEYGEAVAMSAGGMIVPEAMVAFTNALGRNPKDERARFYVGLAESQIGNLRQAVAIWRDLLATADPNAPWIEMVKGHIDSFSKEGHFDPNTIAPSPPSVDSLKAAVTVMAGAMQANGDQLSAPQSAPSADAASDPQMTMIRTMVGRLADRMARNPGDADGWRRLAHAYVVLGEKDKAQAAIAHALALKPKDPDVLATKAETEQMQAQASAPPPPQTAPAHPEMPAASTVPAADPQAQFIRAMVGRLADRMAQNPGDADGWRRLAHAYVVLGDKDKASAAIAHAVKLKPDDPAVLTTLAETQQAHAAPGDEVPADFIATMRRVLKLDPNSLPALYYVGLAESKAGRMDQARSLWNRALLGQNDPDDPLMIAIRNRLGAAASR